MNKNIIKIIVGVLLSQLNLYCTGESSSDRKNLPVTFTLECDTIPDECKDLISEIFFSNQHVKSKYKNVKMSIQIEEDKSNSYEIRIIESSKNSPTIGWMKFDFKSLNLYEMDIPSGEYSIVEYDQKLKNKCIKYCIKCEKCLLQEDFDKEKSKYRIKEGDLYYTLAYPHLNAREKPKKDAPVSNRIPLGTRIKVLSILNFANNEEIDGLKGVWVQVEYKGGKAYVFDAYLSKINPPDINTHGMKDYAMKKLGCIKYLTTNSEFEGDTAKVYTCNGSKYTYEVGGGYEWNHEEIVFDDSITIQEIFLITKILYWDSTVIKCNEVDAPDNFKIQNIKFKDTFSNGIELFLPHACSNRLSISCRLGKISIYEYSGC